MAFSVTSCGTPERRPVVVSMIVMRRPYPVSVRTSSADGPAMRRASPGPPGSRYWIADTAAKARSALTERVGSASFAAAARTAIERSERLVLLEQLEAERELCITGNDQRAEQPSQLAPPLGSVTAIPPPRTDVDELLDDLDRGRGVDPSLGHRFDERAAWLLERMLGSGRVDEHRARIVGDERALRPGGRAAERSSDPTSIGGASRTLPGGGAGSAAIRSSMASRYHGRHGHASAGERPPPTGGSARRRAAPEVVGSACSY